MYLVTCFIWSLTLSSLLIFLFVYTPSSTRRLIVSNNDNILNHNRIRAISFEVTGTLITTRQPVIHTYRDALLGSKLVQVSAKRMEAPLITWYSTSGIVIVWRQTAAALSAARREATVSWRARRVCLSSIVALLVNTNGRMVLDWRWCLDTDDDCKIRGKSLEEARFGGDGARVAFFRVDPIGWRCWHGLLDHAGGRLLDQFSRSLVVDNVTMED